MSSTGRPSFEFGDGFGDQPVDVERFAAALRRGAGLIVKVTVLITAAVVLISNVLPKTYQSSATVVFNPATTLLQPTDAASIQRELATFQAFVQSPSVIAAAARSLSETPAAVKDATQSSTDANANIITITATAPQAALAARRANAVARAFVTSQAKMQAAGFQAAAAQLRAQIDRLSGTPNSAAQVSALRDRIAALQISAAGTPSQLQVGEPATASTSAASPKPALNGLIALVATLLIATLFVLARDQFRPRFATARSLGRALGAPVLVSIPRRGWRRRRAVDATEQRAYDALRAALTVDDTPGAASRVFLVTSATRGQGKATVTVRLGRSLARIGQRVLLVSGDLRYPTLHEQLGLRRAAGLGDCLSVAGHDAKRIDAELDKWIRRVPGDLSLDLLDAGGAHPDPASLLSRHPVDITLAALRRLPYDYVLIDSAPILGFGDTQLLARTVDEVLLVARLDLISADDVEDLSDLFARLSLRPVGVVVRGANTEASRDHYAKVQGSLDDDGKAPQEDFRYPQRSLPEAAPAPAPPPSSPSRDRKRRSADGGQSQTPRSSPSRDRKRRSAEGGQGRTPRSSPSRERERAAGEGGQSQAPRSSPPRERERAAGDGGQSQAPRSAPSREPRRAAGDGGQSQAPPGGARI